MVAENMKKEHLSIHAVMQEFGINNYKIISILSKGCYS